MCKCVQVCGCVSGCLLFLVQKKQTITRNHSIQSTPEKLGETRAQKHVYDKGRWETSTNYTEDKKGSSNRSEAQLKLIRDNEVREVRINTGSNKIKQEVTNQRISNRDTDLTSCRVIQRRLDYKTQDHDKLHLLVCLYNVTVKFQNILPCP